jgi:type I restriction enzyme R subunit
MPFYTAVASNDSAKELMQHDQLRELAIVLTQKVRENDLLAGPSKKV